MNQYSIRSVSEYKKQQSLHTKKLWQEGKYNFLRTPLELKTRECQNLKCSRSFTVQKLSVRNIYCSSSCAATVNNTMRIRRKTLIKSRCLFCGEIPKREGYKYCSNQCQQDQVYKEYIRKWQGGFTDGSIGITTKTLSGHIRRYLKNKYGEKCFLCGWNQKHPLTGHIPVEIDHIDGNAENNKEENLRLICPNCHSLTASFRNLNKGKGRAWRLTYIANHKIVSK